MNKNNEISQKDDPLCICKLMFLSSNNSNCATGIYIGMWYVWYVHLLSLLACTYLGTSTYMDPVSTPPKIMLQKFCC